MLTTEMKKALIYLLLTAAIMALFNDLDWPFSVKRTSVVNPMSKGIGDLYRVPPTWIEKLSYPLVSPERYA